MSLRWLPNAISLLRIALIAPIIALIVHGDFAWALLLFIIAGASDGIDGFLAKHFDWSSRLGAFLDPAGDKLLVAWTFGTLAFLEVIPAWLAVLVILRDVVIVAGAFLYNYLVEPLAGEPSRISKLNTAFELLFLVCVLARAGFGWPEEITITVLGASVMTTVVISGFDYVATWVRGALAGAKQ